MVKKGRKGGGKKHEGVILHISIKWTMGLTTEYEHDWNKVIITE